MSASTDSSTTDVDGGSEDKAPLLSALFLIKFDQKVGYIIAWKRSAVDVALDGAVEFKSLPSGLHSVKSDLVYFVHEGYAGLSAFVSGPASEAERNAHLVAVGVLVPLSYGRLGRSWLHARSLQKIASALADDPSFTTPLEEYWEQHGSDKGRRDAQGSKFPARQTSENFAAQAEPWKGHSRARALSNITAELPSEQSLPSFHPALSIMQYINVFGPLVFRLQQAALLRKRILFIASPPVRTTCEFVYNLSVLSSIPHSVSDLLPPGSENLHRLRSLFSIGIHDIPFLEQLRSGPDDGSQSIQNDASSQGWVACTTDEILGTKTQLYDVIVTIPPAYDAAPSKRAWPTIRTSDGSLIRASQRDVWRYKLLRHELWKHRHGNYSFDSDANSDEHAALLAQDDVEALDNLNEVYDDKVVEPMTWSQLAYSGFMWWASAGEKDAYISEIRDRDREVLGDLSDFLPTSINIPSHSQNGTTDIGLAPHEVVQAGLHTAIIAYFHRLTSLMITGLAEMVEAADEEDIDGGELDALMVGRDDVSRIGLDGWSALDQTFIEEVLWVYFGRRAIVKGVSLECCGVRIG
ncbi:hypothetical protein K469DRAFT_710457 [Zopfia rhizophila CBS 207.26]|uniref:DUF4484 domain-containing protein n=1 Tax=Zopfia rhizophila CBS 207.26 TaxID=1314779 RepID=A0A6A6DY03_9PEZI|nr:hypothetical protein K469DRAFT_710457 [Zopfia rhizophila CBS 207.26]